MKRPNTLKNYKFSYPPNFSHRDEPAIWQNPVENLQMLYMIQTMKVKSILEIGVGYGMFSNQLKSQDYYVFGIDNNIEKYTLHPTVHMGKSQDKETIDWAESQGPFDAVFIDGGHTYNEVMNDFHNYWRLTTKMMIFHDIASNQEGDFPTDPGVEKVWGEIKKKYATMEIVDAYPYYYGVGIIFKFF